MVDAVAKIKEVVAGRKDVILDVVEKVNKIKIKKIKCRIMS